MRYQIFQQQLEQIEAQNAKPDRLWTATVNMFTDRTAEERARMKGWRRGPSSFSGVAAALVEDTPAKKAPLPEQKDWLHLGTASRIPDQGSCGSCWAVTTVSVLEAHHEIYNGGPPVVFSAQELVSCVANPRKCGGKGGCDGATVELGMDYAWHRGLSKEAETPYEARDLSCKKNMTLVQNDHKGGESFGLTGWQKLPMNKEEPLMRAVVERGPVGVSVSADGWFQYGGGIFDKCDRNCTVDHAVTLYGYGVDKSESTPVKYWLIRNSWGAAWGDKGFIKVKRHDKEDDYRGWDTDAQKGTACEGDPSLVEVSGTCGILYDSVVPTFRSKNILAESEADSMSIVIGADATAKLLRRDSLIGPHQA